MIRLVRRKLGAVGEGVHRSGWPYVLHCLKPMISDKGILFDDFVEASFSYNPIKLPHREPWVGVFHHPFDAPEFLHRRGESINGILKNPNFKDSLHFLKLGITFSSPLSAWLQKTLDIPFVTLTHPIETRVAAFSETDFLANKKKRIIQIGWYLRNTSAISQLKAPHDYTKTCLILEKPWVKDYMNRVAFLWQNYNWCNQWNHKKVDRLPYGTVEISGHVSNDIYDRLLSENVIFIEFFSTAANNAVIECIIRNTPLVINRLPALEEYLGKDYPLFFDCFEDATGLFAVDKILAGHMYLKGLDKRPFTCGNFQSHLTGALQSYGSI